MGKCPSAGGLTLLAARTSIVTVVPLLNDGARQMTERLLRYPAMKQRCGYSSRDTYYRLIKDGRFPAPVQLAGGRAVAWRESEIERWIAEQSTVASEGRTQ